jgi:hypothetical protein
MSGSRPRAVFTTTLTRRCGRADRGDVDGEGVTAFGARWYVLSPAANQVTGSPTGSGPGGLAGSGC